MGPMHESVCVTPLASAVSLEALILDRPGLFDIPDTAPSAEDLCDGLLAAEAVRIFLARLSERQRDLLVRIFWNEETQAEAARALGISEAAVSKSLSKILATGRKRLSRFRNTRLNGLHLGNAAVKRLAA
jgi:DNA-directed RNA polymerase specialized sigma24 family protein